MVSTKIRVPEKLYIQTLIAGKFNASMVVDDLEAKKIRIPTNEMLAIRDELLRSNPQYFQDQTNTTPDDEWLEQTELSPMFYYRFKRQTDKSLQGLTGAFAMLEDPRMVKYINCLALSGVDQTDLELILNAKYNISFEPFDFAMFLKYFANYEGWTYTDKELFIGNYPDPTTKAAYKLALTGDRAQLIWELGLGTDPSISFDDLLRDMLTDSYFYFKKKLKLNPEEAQKFEALAVKIADRLDKSKGEGQEAQDLLSELKIKLTTTDTTKKTSDDTPKDINDLDVELPTSTDLVVPNIEALMNEGKL